jgi:hypothetical protein
MTYVTMVETFRKLVNIKPLNAAAIANIQALFVPDVPAPPGPPNVGLTTGGPQFNSQAGIHSLFAGLSASFPNLVLAYPNTLRPEDGNVVAVEAILTTGAQAAPWAPPGANPSPPLSVIQPAPFPGQPSILPLCAVFTFDRSSGNIQNLALYFDRWKLAMDLWDGAHPPSFP